MVIRIDKQLRKWYDYNMKKTNDKVSQHKIKRANKNKKRIQSKPQLSRFERKQAFLREQILLHSMQHTSQNS
jgi:hypothetical protein